MNPAADALGVVNREPWTVAAKCRERRDTFDCDQGRKSDTYRAAVDECNACPVLDRCREFVLREFNGLNGQVWAGELIPDPRNHSSRRRVYARIKDALEAPPVIGGAR